MSPLSAVTLAAIVRAKMLAMARLPENPTPGTVYVALTGATMSPLLDCSLQIAQDSSASSERFQIEATRARA
jgi:hypothetical protein